MFDAKSVIDAMMRGAAQPRGQGAGGGLGDILGQVLAGGRGAPGSGTPGGLDLEELLRRVTQPGAPGAAGGGLGDLLGGAMRNMTSGGGGAGGGGLDDLLRRIQGGQSGGQSGGSILDILGQVLSQATQGAKEGAQRIDERTGASERMRDALGRATGQSPDELLARLRELISNNQLGTGAALGGLGALVLGTEAGRSLAGSAVKLGALALIGGLAYKAYQNYSAGRPPLATSGSIAHEEAPAGSGFEEQAVSQDAARTYLRGMIAAAAADGRLAPEEREKILGGLKTAGLDAEAEEFIASEINNPASVDELASAVRTQEEAVQLYTAARLAIHPDTPAEQEFLAALARALGIDRTLAAHVDAAARSA